MNRSKKLLIIISIGAVLACSVVFALSESGYVMSVSEEVSSENIPKGPETLPPLTSHEEAITLADEFLIKKLGSEFFINHFNVIGVDETSHMLYTWNVLYRYVYNGYTVDLTVAINIGPIQEDTSRIKMDSSIIILSPQKILISEEHAKSIAQEYGLEPPYIVVLSCEVEYHRICWRIMKKDRENLSIDDLAGLLIDAENGTILKTWIKGS